MVTKKQTAQLILYPFAYLAIIKESMQRYKRESFGEVEGFVRKQNGSPLQAHAQIAYGVRCKRKFKSSEARMKALNRVQSFYPRGVLELGDFHSHTDNHGIAAVTELSEFDEENMREILGIPYAFSSPVYFRFCLAVNQTDSVKNGIAFQNNELICVTPLNNYDADEAEKRIETRLRVFYLAGIDKKVEEAQLVPSKDLSQLIVQNSLI